MDFYTLVKLINIFEATVCIFQGRSKQDERGWVKGDVFTLTGCSLSFGLSRFNITICYADHTFQC